MNKIKAFFIRQWDRLSDSTKIKVISGFNTFGSVFLSTLAPFLAAGVEWTWAFWAGILSVGVRAAWKALIVQLIPMRLGGVK